MTASVAPAVRVTDVTRTYSIAGKPVQALRGVSLEVPRGAFIALEGRSGSGKTTLLNLIGGLDEPSTGEVEIYGQQLGALSEERLTRLRREQLGFIFQSFALLPIFSAFENVEVPLRIEGKLSRDERHARVHEALALVGLEKQASQRPPELSGGQQQRVAIARALITQPKLLLADEPTGELDSVTGRTILELLRKITHSTGVTLVIATHDRTVRNYADVVYEMSDGQLTEKHIAGEHQPAAPENVGTSE
jgi:putative ABC transport system ATP-binding protein